MSKITEDQDQDWGSQLLAAAPAIIGAVLVKNPGTRAAISRKVIAEKAARGPLPEIATEILGRIKDISDKYLRYSGGTSVSRITGSLYRDNISDDVAKMLTTYTDAERAAATKAILGRQTWYRGAKSYPKPMVSQENQYLLQRETPDMGGQVWMRYPNYGYTSIGRMKFGEPRGISMSILPGVASKFYRLPRTRAALYEAIWERLNKRVSEAETGDIAHKYSRIMDALETRRHRDMVARVVPLFGGPPEQRLLLGGGRQGSAVLTRAYKGAMEDTARKLVGQNVDRAETLDALLGMGSEYGYGIDFNRLRDRLRQLGVFDYFGKQLTRRLHGEGYKGILYSPRRYGEYELKMFNPEDAVQLDVRPAGALTSRGVSKHRSPGKDPLDVVNEFIEEKRKLYSLLFPKMESGSLRDIYKKIDLDKVLADIKRRL